MTALATGAATRSARWRFVVAAAGVGVLDQASKLWAVSRLGRITSYNVCYTKLLRIG